MTRPIYIATGATALACALFTSTVCGQTPARTHTKLVLTPTQVSAAKLTPSERGQLTRQFVLKWGIYVQRIYNVPVGTWAKRMVPNFATVDSVNFRNALKRETFEGAMAELSGTGHRLSDTQAIDRLAKLAPGANTPGAVAAKFGDLNQDLVYTPIQPCRIVDTRSTAAGQIAASSSRSFVAINSSDFTSQGGSATNCGTFGLSATAVALNVTAVTPVANGFTTVYPFNTTRPLSSNINYFAGITAANGVIATIPNPTVTSDFTIFSDAQSHYIVDILGYFAPPAATALQCSSVDGTLRTLTAGEYALLSTVNCPAGYSAVSAGLTASQDVLMADSYISAAGVQIFAKNVSTLSQQAIPKAICCRVPGR